MPVIFILLDTLEYNTIRIPTQFLTWLLIKLHHGLVTTPDFP